MCLNSPLLTILLARSSGWIPFLSSFSYAFSFSFSIHNKHHDSQIEHFSYWYIFLVLSSLSIHWSSSCLVPDLLLKVSSTQLELWWSYSTATHCFGYFVGVFLGGESLPTHINIFSFTFCTLLSSLFIHPRCLPPCTLPPAIIIKWIFLHPLFPPSIQCLFPLVPPPLCKNCSDICSLPRLLAACSSALWSDCCLSQDGAIH